MTQLEKRLETELFALQDLRYKAFQTKLMPGVAPESVIGVRMPALRGLARAWGKTPDAPAFLKLLPHRYYEENNLHGLLICTMHDFSEAVAALDDFLPYVNNWATCDMINPRIFGKHLPDLLPHIRKNGSILGILTAKTIHTRANLIIIVGLWVNERIE